MGAKRGRGVPHAVDAPMAAFFTTDVARMAKGTVTTSIAETLMVQEVASSFAFVGWSSIRTTTVMSWKHGFSAVVPRIGLKLGRVSGSTGARNCVRGS